MGCVPLNTFDLTVLYDNGESGIVPVYLIWYSNKASAKYSQLDHSPSGQVTSTQ